MLSSAFSEVLSSLNYRTVSKNSHGPTKMEQMRSLELKKEKFQMFPFSSARYHVHVRQNKIPKENR